MLRPPSSSRPIHLLLDSTELRLCGPGEWLVEKYGTRTRRSWRKLHLGVDADTGEIVAAELTSNDIDDGSQVGPLLDQGTRPVASPSETSRSDVVRAGRSAEPYRVCRPQPHWFFNSSNPFSQSARSRYN